VRITFIGHSTVLIELDGRRFLTDPILRRRVAHLVRAGPAIDPDTIADVDSVLISHLHHDHFDPVSLRLIGGRSDLIVPRGALEATARLRFERVVELGVGETHLVDGTAITATAAQHRRGRLFDQRSEAIGFTITGTQRVYFAGDTDLFPEMSELRGELDVALLPVSGWGPTLGPGHLDAQRAAEALALLEPRVAIPIHWGTLHRFGLRRAHRALQMAQPRLFAEEAARRAPSAEVRILQPGETTTV
jgi:L-ascorbate metabolism protein UlaG (beta-lactamase superfamily)